MPALSFFVSRRIKKDYRSSTVRGFSLIPLTAHVTASDARPQFRKIMLKLKNIFFATYTQRGRKV